MSVSAASIRVDSKLTQQDAGIAVMNGEGKDKDIFDRRESDAHLNRVEKSLSTLVDARVEIARLDTELRSAVSTMKAIQDSMSDLNRAVDTLKEARMNMMLMSKTVLDNEKNIEDLKIAQAKQAQKAQQWEWFVGIVIAAGGVLVTAVAVLFGTNKE